MLTDDYSTFYISACVSPEPPVLLSLHCMYESLQLGNIMHPEIHICYKLCQSLHSSGILVLHVYDSPLDSRATTNALYVVVALH